MCNNSLRVNRSFLRKKKEEARAKDPQGWEALYNYPEQLKPAPRQDRGVSHPLTPEYSKKDLQSLDLDTSYDTTCHLSRLNVVAHKMDKIFQKSVKTIFEIDEKTGWSKDKTVHYRGGPLKDLKRCKEKVENSYASQDYPTSSKLIDFIRCSLTFKTPTQCVSAINRLFEEALEGTTHIKKVARLKNM